MGRTIKKLPKGFISLGKAYKEAYRLWPDSCFRAQKQNYINQQHNIFWVPMHDMCGAEVAVMAKKKKVVDEDEE